MGLRFRKSIKIAPGVKINFNKKSSSITFGGKGVHYTMNSKGKKTASVGIPGTGLSYTKSSGGGSKAKKHTSNGGTQSMSQNNFQGSGSDKKWYQKTGWIIALLIFFFPVGLFLMWKYTDWKKPIKWIVTALILICAFIGIAFPDNLESINLKANSKEAYDINQNVKITVATTPSDYELSNDDFQCSSGNLSYSNGKLSFSASKAGLYSVWAEHNGIKSNTLSFKIEDKAAIAKKEQEKKAEEERIATEKAKQEEQERLAAEQAEAEAQAQAQAQAEAQTTSQAQENNDPVVYITQSGNKYHRSGCRYLKKSSIEKRLSEVKGSYSPCGVCNPPQ